MPNLEQYLLRTVRLVRNDKTEIKELNSLSIVRISISTYTQTRKKKVGSRMARISVAYSKSLPILEENDELSKHSNEQKCIQSRQTANYSSC